MNEKVKIYISLLNEGVDVWRPVEAEMTSVNSYKILGTVPESEEWQFQPGDIVNCREQKISGEICLVAYKTY